MGGGDHLRAGEASLAEDAVEGENRQGREEEEEAAELGMEGTGPEIELLDVGDGRGRGSDGRGPLVIGAAGQTGKALGLEDLVDGDGAEGVAVGLKSTADVIDGEVLLAEGDDAVAEGQFLGGGVRPLGGREEEGTLGVFAEVVRQDAKTGGGVAEAFGDLGGGEALDKEGAQGFILAVGGGGGLEEVVREGY